MSVFNHFVGLTLKGLSMLTQHFITVDMKRFDGLRYLGLLQTYFLEYFTC